MTKQRSPEWRTQALTLTPRERQVAQFRVEVVSGPDQGIVAISDGAELAIGTGPGNQLILTDSTVSRHHCQIAAVEDGFVLRDLGSTNGTTLAGYRVLAAYLEPNAVVGVGQTVLRFDVTNGRVIEPLSDRTHLGEVLGESPAMRRLFFVLDRAVGSDTTVLLEGETGTGKTMIAEAVHQSGPRARAVRRRRLRCGIGVADRERAVRPRARIVYRRGGPSRACSKSRRAARSSSTIGELPLDLQPSRARARRQDGHPIGSTRSTKLDVRIIAATNRDLRAEVNNGKFRSDLFYRISTLRVRVPALRERIEDLAPLVDRFYRELAGADASPPAELLTAVLRHAWPGNVRELRSFVERSYLLGAVSHDNPPPAISDDVALSFRDAKARATSAWEADWLSRLVKTYSGNLSRAARAAQMDRNHLRDLLRRYEIEAI
jgi:transcriptional regulator of acetoin/glycerol metabolism